MPTLPNATQAQRLSRSLAIVNGNGFTEINPNVELEIEEAMHVFDSCEDDSDDSSCSFSVDHKEMDDDDPTWTMGEILDATDDIIYPVVENVMKVDADTLFVEVFGSIQEEEGDEKRTDGRKRKRTYAPRRYYRPIQTEETFWYKEWLCEEAMAKIRNPHNDDDERDGVEFRQHFIMPYAVFEEWVERTMAAPEFSFCLKTDAIGRPSKDIRLLILGSMMHLGHGTSFGLMRRYTGIGSLTLLNFFKKWCGWIMSIKDQYIFLPETEVEMCEAEEMYRELGYPGCIGSIDAVKIGWDKCPASLRNIYKSSDKSACVVFQVISNQSRRILHVGEIEPGSRNDKTTIKFDPFMRHMHYGSHHFKDRIWWCTALDGSKITNNGLYFICDGGYLRWPCLICSHPVLHNSLLTNMSTLHAGVRKDIECTFGSLKKRFTWLKHWNSLHDVRDIEAVFVSCCVFHNDLLVHDGYDNSSTMETPGSFRSIAAEKYCEKKGSCMDFFGAPDDPTLVDDEDVTGTAEEKWNERINRIACHQHYCKHANK